MGEWTSCGWKAEVFGQRVLNCHVPLREGQGGVSSVGFSVLHPGFWLQTSFGLDRVPDFVKDPRCRDFDT